MSSDKIADVLNIDPQPLAIVEELTDIPEDKEFDINTARLNLHNLIQKGNMALNDLIGFASQSQTPRAYEVIAELIKTLNSSSRDLLEIQKTAKELEKNDPNKETVNNNLFIGSTSDAIKLIQENTKNE